VTEDPSYSFSFSISGTGSGGNSLFARPRTSKSRPVLRGGEASVTACHRPPGLFLASSVLGSCRLNGEPHGFLPSLAFLSSSSSFDEHPPSAHASPWKICLGICGYYRRPPEVSAASSNPICSCCESALGMSRLASDQDRASRRSTSHVSDGDSRRRRRSTVDRFSASVSARSSLTVEKRGSCTKMIGRQTANKQLMRKICPAIDRGLE
jgi:hypothetical protein